VSPSGHCEVEFVMAGLDPAIHVFVPQKRSKTWIAGTSPTMTR
jgi:hypothetical protein